MDTETTDLSMVPTHHEVILEERPKPRFRMPRWARYSLIGFSAIMVWVIISMALVFSSSSHWKPICEPYYYSMAANNALVPALELDVGGVSSAFSGLCSAHPILNGSGAVIQGLINGTLPAVGGG